MQRPVAIIELCEVDCSQAAALAVIQDIRTIEQTEVKVDSVQVLPQTARTGIYKAHGSFAFVRWRNEFAYTLNEMGFHSVEAHPPPAGIRIHGGFVVVEAGPASCIILHYEQYELPRWAVPIKPVIGAYLRWTMKKEMRDLKALILSRAGSSLAA